MLRSIKKLDIVREADRLTVNACEVYRMDTHSHLGIKLITEISMPFLSDPSRHPIFVEAQIFKSNVSQISQDLFAGVQKNTKAFKNIYKLSVHA